MDAKEMILSDLCPPLLISNAISHWPAAKWNLRTLAEYLGNKKFSCKLAPLNTTSDSTPIYETDCLYNDATILEFLEWCTRHTCSQNSLHKFPKEKFSCYVDYKYMKDMFGEKQECLQDVNWDIFGFDNRDGNDSTIWIGSDGASTPCHYDTYGFNLVSQIYGRKRWLLFPPTDTKYLYPTRIPYEESSVFAMVDVTIPDLDKFPLFKKCSPIEIVLEPGQVLFVPRHWWHYVECIEPSISINTWVEIEEDREERLRESITRLMFSTFYQQCLENQQSSIVEKWLNPNEELVPFAVSLEYIRIMLMSVQNSCTGLHEGNVKQSKTQNNTDTNLYKFASSFDGIIAQPCGSLQNITSSNFHSRRPQNETAKHTNKTRKRHSNEQDLTDLSPLPENKKNCYSFTSQHNIKTSDVHCCGKVEEDNSHENQTVQQADFKPSSLTTFSKRATNRNLEIKVNYLTTQSSDQISPDSFLPCGNKCATPSLLKTVLKIKESDRDNAESLPIQSQETKATVSEFMSWKRNHSQCDNIQCLREESFYGSSSPCVDAQDSVSTAKASLDVCSENCSDNIDSHTSCTENGTSAHFIRNLVSSFLHPDVIEKIVHVLKNS